MNISDKLLFYLFIIQRIQINNNVKRALLFQIDNLCCNKSNMPYSVKNIKNICCLSYRPKLPYTISIRTFCNIVLKTYKLWISVDWAWQRELEFGRPHLRLVIKIRLKSELYFCEYDMNCLHESIFLPNLSTWNTLDNDFIVPVSRPGINRYITMDIIEYILRGFVPTNTLMCSRAIIDYRRTEKILKWRFINKD